MKTLIVYYSRSGNTAKVANAVAEELGGDVDEIVDVKNRAGFFGYLSAAWDTIFNNETDIEPLEKRPADYDLVVIGTPIWNWKVPAPTRAFFGELAGRVRRAAVFCTGDNGESPVLAAMAELLGRKPIESQHFTEKSVSDGNYRATAGGFAAKLKSHFGLA
jgi:flavodoxin